MTAQPFRDGGSISVFIVDDHAVVRQGLRSLCDTVDDVHVVGEAADGVVALDLLELIEPPPQVLVLDLQMPKASGMAVIQQIRELYPAIAILVLTGFGTFEDARAALSLGASGFLLKDADPEEIITAIRAASRGEMPLDPSVTAFLTAGPSAVDPDESATPITPREREIAILLAEGLSNREIGARLAISERTARTHVSNLLRKLQLSSRTQVALWATKVHLASGKQHDDW